MDARLGHPYMCRVQIIEFGRYRELHFVTFVLMWMK